MHPKQITIERFSIVSSHPFQAVMSRIDREIDHPGMSVFIQGLAAAPSFSAMETHVRKAAPSGLMEFVRFDLGVVLRKDPGAAPRQSVRLLIGNPVIMQEMAKYVPDAGSYAPVTVLIDERAGGVHLSYDRMAAFLAPYGSSEASRVARDLDAKVEALLTKVAQ